MEKIRDKTYIFVWKGIDSFIKAWKEFMAGKGQIAEGETIAFVGDGDFLLALLKRNGSFKMQIDEAGFRKYDYLICHDEYLDSLNAGIIKEAIENK